MLQYRRRRWNLSSREQIDEAGIPLAQAATTNQDERLDTWDSLYRQASQSDEGNFQSSPVIH